jgi:citrate-Mg2+:H+ or citrate-Ca2+:H+ symporter, CitMHS family
MNILPWGGPTARAAAALKLEASDIFVPMIPAMAAGAAWVLFVAYLLGKRERVRLGAIDPGTFDGDDLAPGDATDLPSTDLRRPKLLPINFALTLALMAALLVGLLPLPVLFLVAFALALVINFPRIEQQKERVAEHAANALAVASVICAAGVLTGILSGTKMIDAMGQSVVNMVPVALGPHLAILTGLLSIPFTFFLSNDAFYFGVLPILAQAGATFGISAAEIGRASIIGQPVHLLSPLVPSTYLLVGLAEVELGDHQKFTLKWSAITSLVLLAIGLLTAVIPWAGHQ